jgi:hypothetical protein
MEIFIQRCFYKDEQAEKIHKTISAVKRLGLGYYTNLFLQPPIAEQAQVMLFAIHFIAAYLIAVSVLPAFLGFIIYIRLF